jgi:ferritin-like metal-binding protein YciE
MHGRIPRGPHEYHVVAALFDTATGVRISDAAVTAQISGLGLSGSSKKLERMEIAGSTTYGAFFNLSGRDLYTVKLTSVRAHLDR